MKKHPLKSKTIQGLLIAAVIVLMSILGIGEEQAGKTIDAMVDSTGQSTESAKELGLLVTIVYSIYGRTVANGSLKWRKEDEEEN